MAAVTTIELPVSFEPAVLMFVDTEESFDWSQPIGTAPWSIDALPHLASAHKIFKKHKITPHYLVDYPVATSPQMRDILNSLAAMHPLEVGAHLHPWVTPPHEEVISELNSFAGNLAPELELAKLKAITNAIKSSLGYVPTVYKAGRYGIGPNTPSHLHSLGYKIDVSVRSGFNYSYNGGPDFSKICTDPYWLNNDNGILEIPASTAYSGALSPWGAAMHELFSIKGQPSIVNGILSKLGLLSRLSLTPEGYTIREAFECIEKLVVSGTKVFAISFHSPSLQVGNTPYVQNERQLNRQLEWLDAVLSHLINTVGASPSTALSIYDRIKAAI